MSPEYSRESSRPLHILIFVLPLVILYEVGAVVYLRPAAGMGGAGVEQTIKAHRMLGDFFHSFGVAGVYLPAAAIVTVLLLWHVLSNERWKVKPWVLAAMGLESIVWTLPLLVLSAMHARAMGSATPAAALAMIQQPADAQAEWARLAWQARATIAIGAGLYEELLFRFIGVALLHFLVRDIGKLKEGVAATIAVVGAAIAFALYHHTRLATGDMDWPKTLFIVAAGLYFGMLYILRGFGIVVGTHAIYDVLVLVMLT
ncbi:MAG: CPBP family glutamic-type intramembrane protease [Phycisphaerales bacterium]